MEETRFLDELGHLRTLFNNPDSTLEQHRKSITEQPSLYAATIINLLQWIDLSSGVKSRALTVASENKAYRPLGSYLLSHKQFTLPEVLKAVKFLDSRRQIRSYEKRLELIRQRKNPPQTEIATLTSRIADISKEVSPSSLSGNTIKRFKYWCRSISAKNLEFFALTFTKEPWRELSDLLHLSPSDFQIPYFLDYIYSKGGVPEDSLMHAGYILTPENINELILEKGYELPYRFLRTKPGFRDLSEPLRNKIAGYTDLTTLLWWYEELSSPTVNVIIQNRLQEPNPLVKLTYAKILDRMLYFSKIGANFYQHLIPIANQKIEKVSRKFQIPAQITILADASKSMQISIEVSTIISSLFSNLISDARLYFFNHQILIPPFIPYGIESIINLSQIQRASGGTSPAAAIEYLDKKNIMSNFLIFFTDEIENSPNTKGEFFLQAFQNYKAKFVNDTCQIALVSFSDAEVGPMALELRKQSLDPILIRLSKKKPDLSKIDQLLGLLMVNSSHFFKEQIKSLSTDLTKNSFSILKNFKPAAITNYVQPTNNIQRSLLNEPTKNVNIEKTSSLVVEFDPSKHDYLTDLSTEMLVHIFKFFNNFSDLTTIACVCRRLYLISLDPHLQAIVRNKTPLQLDLNFCIDTTHSMGPYITSIQENIQMLVSEILKITDSYQISFVGYRDHPPQELTYVTKSIEFSSVLSEIHNNILSFAPYGGGDSPEEVACAFTEVLKLKKWRRGSTKVCIWATDAPPHGLELGPGDGFPEGCPLGHDPIALAREMTRRGIVVYAVGCEPGISGYRFARDFMIAISEITEGGYFDLKDSGKIIGIVFGGMMEQLELDKMKGDILKYLAEREVEEKDEGKLVQEVWEWMKMEKMEMKVVKAGQAVGVYASELVKCRNLKEGKEKLAELRKLGAKDPRFRMKGVRGEGESVEIAQEIVSLEQVWKVWRRMKMDGSLKNLKRKPPT